MLELLTLKVDRATQTFLEIDMRPNYSKIDKELSKIATGTLLFLKFDM